MGGLRLYRRDFHRHRYFTKRLGGGSWVTYPRYGCEWKTWNKAVAYCADRGGIARDGHKTTSLADAEALEHDVCARLLVCGKDSTPNRQIQAERVLRLANTLPTKQKQALRLWMLGWSHAEIAQRVGCTEEQSRWRVADARKSIESRLEAN